MNNILNFKEEKIQAVTLDELKQTIMEKYPNGTPVGGIYHYVLLQKLMEWMQEAGYEPEVADMFAVNNQDRYRPGVTFDPAQADKYGKTDPRAFMLRRVYCNIVMRRDVGGWADGPMYAAQVRDSMRSEDISICCAVSYSQRGISVAFGSRVKYCRNLCLLGAERVFTNYSIGIEKGKYNLSKATDECLDKVYYFLTDHQHLDEEIALELSDFCETVFSDVDYQRLLEILMRLRICHDTKDKSIYRTGEYALGQAQINNACERYLIDRARSMGELTFYDAFNLFNTDLKPDKADTAQVIPQSIQLGNVFKQVLDMKKNG